MSGTNQLRVVSIILLLLLGGGGIVWGIWIHRKSEEFYAARARLRAAEMALLRLEMAVWIQEVRLRSALLERISGQALPSLLLRQSNLKEALKNVESSSRALGHPLPPLRELIERVLLLEKRHIGWRRALEKSERKEEYLPVFEQYYAEGPGLLSGVDAEIQRFSRLLQEKVQAQETSHKQSLHTLQLIGIGSIGGYLLLSILLVLLIGRKEKHLLREIGNAAGKGEPLPLQPGPLYPLIQAYNQLLHRWNSLLAVTEALAEKRSNIAWSEVRTILGPPASYLEHLAQENTRQEELLQQHVEEKRKLHQQLQAMEKLFSEQIEALRLEIGALQNLIPLAETNPEGEILSKNDLFVKIPHAQNWKNIRDISGELLSLIQSTKPSQGVLHTPNGSFLYFYLPYRKGREEKGLFSLISIGELTQKVHQLEKALGAAQHQLAETEATLTRLRQQYSGLGAQYTQEVERLLRQRQSLQTLLKIPALQKGDVIEGLAAICEVAATLDADARYSFWVFGENQDTLHCLEAYDPTLLTHSNSVDLPSEAARWVRERLDPATPGPHVPEPSALQAYLAERQSQSLWMFPLYLDDEIAGAFFVERLSPLPLSDTEYPALLGRIASLLLQQGHRKLIEQELLSYLEQAQALEEELRQNIEELEASAEEMRRTQAELRGQITAINAAALVAEMNPEGRLIYVNEAFLRLFGHAAEELIGAPYAKLRRPEEASIVEKLFERLRAGETWQEVVSYLNRYNEEIWLQQTITPVRQSDGDIYKFILVAFDITLQKQQETEIQSALLLAREQEQLLRENTEELKRSNENYRVSQLQLSAQLEALNNAAWLFETDGEGKLTYASQSLLEALGYTHEKLLHAHYGALFSERQPIAVLQGHWRSMQSGQIWKSEVELRGSVGQTYWAIMSSTPIIDKSRTERKGHILKTVNVLFDITEQKEQEFRLKEQQNALSTLAAHPALREGDTEKAFQVIAEVALQTLKAYRVSLWLYQEPDQARCVAVAEKEAHSHTVGTVTNRSLYPLYFQSLEREQVIAVVDALSDLRTRELALPLFKPNNVTSVLDGIIRVGAKTAGLISVEHRYTRREWRLDEVNFVRALTSSAASVIEEEQQAYARRLQEAYKQLEQQKQELEEAMRDIRESIRYAKRMQKNILPTDSLLEKYLGKDNYFIIWRPRDRNGVGGDFYWFSDAGEAYFIVVADGTGHGVPGAFMTLIGSILLDQIINKSRIYSPAQILHDLHIGVRQVLRQDIEGDETPSRDGMDIALVCYYPKTYRLLYAGANLPLYYTQGTELKEIKPDKKAIGGEQLEEERFFTEHEVQLEPGDTFFLFTDGVVDQSGGPAGKRFGTKQLKEFILETFHEPSMPRRRALFNIRWKEWKDYAGEGEQIDDVTMWGIRLW
ncbi:MAG: PAS domain S-box protein [Bacteroidia bacterium]|nr:PAS domain S-box protein [Bacteroidia bacterium]